MPYSHHSHSGQYCKHASGLLEEVVQEAIRQHFQIYGLTEHVPRYREVDLYPEEVRFLSPIWMLLRATHFTSLMKMGVIQIDTLSNQFDHFVVEAHRLKQLYAPQITLLVGLETDYITNTDLEGLESLLQRHGESIEYIVGGIHHINEIPIDFDFSTYRKALQSFSIEKEEEDRQEAFMLAYFDAQYELIQRFKPEVIAHFDLCRLYDPNLRFADFPDVLKKIERNICFAVDYGALFEINTAALRKNWPSPYPAKDVVEVCCYATLTRKIILYISNHSFLSLFSSQIIHRHNGRFTLSDDSHGPHAVGLNYHRLPEYLQAVAISELWFLQRSNSPNVAGRNIQAVQVKLDGEWLDHEFWRTRSIP